MHIIKFRYPWQKQLEGSSEREKVEVPEPPSRRTSAAVSVLAIYTRNFNKPTGLEDAKHVTLFVSDWQGTLKRLLLNGQSLEIGQAPIEIDVSSLLKPSNRIEIQLLGNEQLTARLSGEVQLRIAE
ncbi:hypothetical protein [Novipirellula aureliae]|uniref:hypothetical protein n=1 Tax=Novipirellula aureliae TaxID=2527966 RepID=UPI0011B66308|nr:hypothetical protein [Novipirellula aureliae]